MSKSRSVTISILVTAFLLASFTQLLIDPAIRPRGEVEIEYTTPINQNITYVVDRESFLSVNSIVVLNTSETSLSGYIDGILPRFDYDRIIFNLTVSLSNISARASFYLWIDHGAMTKLTPAMEINNMTTFSLELNPSELQDSSDSWFFEFAAGIQPSQVGAMQNLVVWVESSIPLSPISIDLQTTDGLSLFDGPMFRQIRSRLPYLDIFKDNNITNRNTLWPNMSNLTFYLRPGGLSGTAKWHDWSYSDDFVPFNVTYALDEKITLKIRMRVARIYLHIDSNYPLTNIRISEPDYSETPYDLYVTPGIFPSFLYYPVHRYPLWEHVSRSISISIQLVDLRYQYSYSRATLLSASGQASLNGTSDIDVYVVFGQSVIYGMMLTSDLIQWLLSCALFLLVLIRIGLAIRTPTKNIRLEFRLIPIVLFLILALVPWYGSTTSFNPIDQDFNIAIHSLSLGPIPIVGFYVDGSTIVWTLPLEASVWFIVAIFLYWLPLLWSAFRFGTPSTRNRDIKMGFFLFLPSILAVYIAMDLPFITGGTTNYLVSSLMIPLIPFLWLSLIGILTLAKQYTIQENGAAREMYALLKRDQEVSIHEEEDAEMIPDRGSLWLKLLADLPTWRGLLVIILFVFLISLPCAIGTYHSIYETSNPSLYPLVPIVSLAEFYNSYAWYSIRLAALIIGLPYFLGATFTIIALWRYTRRELSILWVLLGAFLTYDFLLPGIMIFNYISSVRQDQSITYWITFSSFPIVAILCIVISIFIWLRQAYEDAEEPVEEKSVPSSPSIDET